MASDQPQPPSPALLWTGRVISGLLVAFMLFGASMKFIQPPGTEKGLETVGWPLKYLVFLGITEVVCTILYAIPQTSVLGAILLTGYMGGAIATHARIGENFVFQIIIGVLFWVALYLREPRLRSLAPLRKLS